MLHCLYRALCYICYNVKPTKSIPATISLFLRRIFDMFRALNVHLQEVSCKITAIMVQYMSTHMVYDASSMCGYTVVEAVCWIGE